MSTHFEIQADILAFEEYKDQRRKSSEDSVFPLGLSQFAQEHYDDVQSIREEEELLGEMYELREKKRRVKEWMAESKLASPPEFFIKFKLTTEYAVIDIDTSKMSKGKFNNTWRASNFVKKFISAKIPNWEEDYTFQFSFQEFYGKKSGKAVFFMIPALRRKMESPSRFALDKNTIKNIMAVEDNLIQPLKQYELEQMIIDGELDNVDLFQVDYYCKGQARQRFLKNQMDELYQIINKNPSKENWDKLDQVRDSLEKIDDKLETIKSRIDALQDYSSIPQEFDTRQRSVDELQEDEQVYYNALAQSEHPEAAQWILEDNAFFDMNGEVADYILSTMSDEAINSTLGCTITGLMNLVVEEANIEEQKSKRMAVGINTNYMGEERTNK